MKSFFNNHYKIIILVLLALIVTGFIAFNYIFKSEYKGEVTHVSAEQAIVPSDDSVEIEEMVIPEQEEMDLVIEQTESVDTVDSETYTNPEPIQKLETKETTLTPSELAAELTRVYYQAVEEHSGGQLSAETKDYLNKLTEDLKQLSEADLASMIYYGELSAEVFDVANIMLNPKSFLPFQNFVNSPLAEVGEPSKSSTQYTVEIGINFRSADEDSFDTFMYSQQGNFTGVFAVSPDEGYFEYFLEEIYGVELSTFVDDISFLVTDIREPVTFFFRGNSTGATTIELSGVNDSKNITSLFFPFSSSTRASVTLHRENDVTTVGRWNFDFDGDTVTDFSIGNGKEFTHEQYELIFDILEQDTKLSDSDQAIMKDFRKTFLEFIKKGN